MSDGALVTEGIKKKDCNPHIFGEPLRICFVTPEYTTETSFSGGLANYLERITVALARRGHEVHVVTRSLSNDSFEYKGITVHRVVPLWDKRMFFDHIDRLIPRVVYSPYQDLKAAWCLWRTWRRLHRRNAFHLVQVSNVMSSGLFLRFEKTVPVVTRLSSYRPLWDTSAGVRLNAGVRLRWAMERVAVTQSEYVYAPSRFIANLVGEKYRLNGIRVIESPFFLEPQDEEADSRGDPFDGRPFAMFFGRLTQMKGAHVLAEALKVVMNRLEDFNIFIAGADALAPDGSKMKDFILRQVPGFRHRVKMVDPLKRRELYSYIKRARLVVIPSLQDNMPNTCIESMGFGRPVIATTGSCFEELVEDGQSGFLVAPGDADALAERIISCWQLPDRKLRSVGKRASSRIEQLFPSVIIPRLINYYELVLQDFGERNSSARKGQCCTGI